MADADGAAFALAAALIGSAVLLHQTQAAERREEERRKRKAKALRAALPLMLSDLIVYARRCASIYEKVVDTRDTGDRSWQVAAERWKSWIPPLPDGTRLLADLIEVSDHDHIGPLVELMHFVQFQHGKALELQGRIPSQSDPVFGREVLDVCVIYAAEVIARCNKLLPYARDMAPEPSATITRQDVEKAAAGLPSDLSWGMVQHMHERIKDAIEREAALGRWGD